MSSRLTRLQRPAAAVAAALVGGGALYTFSRSRTTHELPPVELHRDSNGRIVAPSFPSVKSRAEQLADLRRHSTDDEAYDLLVIGGGATGTGIALDAATRGLKVALVEREDFSSGTSSKSTKLVHGGVRYLEKAVWNLDYPQLQLVMEALRERKAFLEIAPHLSQSLPILLPLQRWWQAPYFWAGTKAYDLLAGSQGLESSYYMSKSKALEAFPLLKKDNLVGALVYYDGQHNDSRMNISLALTAALYGATVVNHVEVTELEKDAAGKIRGAKLRDLGAAANGDGDAAEEFTVRARGVINATGPFTDAVERMDDSARKPIVAPSSGAHIILPSHLCPSGMGMLDAATSDGRVVFVLPWQGYTLAGTTDNPCVVEREPAAKQDEIDFILKEVSKLMSPEASLSRKDILATWSGIRPLVRDPNAKNTESLVRSHLVTVSDSGLLTCAGGKWTTYRQMAEDAVDEAIKAFNLTPKKVSLPNVSSLPDAWTTDGKCQTRHARLIGSHGFSTQLYGDLMERFGLDVDVARHLAANYGDRAWQVAADTEENPARASRLVAAFPVIEAEVRHSVRQEYAQTATDFIARRTRVAFLDVHAALEALPKVVDVMGDELKWSQARKDHEWTESVHFLKSMGLPQDLLGITREDVLKGKHTTALRPEEVSAVSGSFTLNGGALGEIGAGTTLARSGTMSGPKI